MKHTWLNLALTALFGVCVQGATFYGLRDARFFGDTTGRETMQSGAFNAATSEQLPVTYTVGSPANTFNALSTTQGSPFQLGVTGSVSIGQTTSLTSNGDFVTPVPFAAIVQSRITDNMTITGGSGVGYLLPTFRIQGSFLDNHASGFARASMCVGMGSCTPLNVEVSTGGAQNVDEFFTPPIGVTTEFTFGVPDLFFFFFGLDLTSNTNGQITPGSLSGNFANGVQLVGFQVVDASGNPISGAVIHSDLYDLLNDRNVPEPGTWGLGAAGCALLVAARRRLKRA